jgi:tRNA A37 threonylcarbamoyladenosine dehydratase
MTQASLNDRRFGGMARLYGVGGAARVAQAHVMVVGIGGVGSWVAESLARSGVTELTLVDMDHIAESNINRQIHALASSVGQAKVLAMKARIDQINPECRVHVVDDFVTPENWLEIVNLVQSDPTCQSPIVAVVDACDQVKAKVTMADWAIRQKKFLVTLGAAGGKREAHRVEQGDLSLVTHDPLWRNCVTDCAKKKVLPRMAKRWGSFVFSVVKMWRHLMPHATSMAMAA